MKPKSSKTKESEKCSSKKAECHNVKVNTKDGTKTTLKKSRSSIPIVYKAVCPKTSCCIRITNISRKVTTNNIRQLFSEFGTIKNLNLHFNNYDKKSKGFSYIMFSTPDESKIAVEAMNKCEIDGLEITCELWFLPYLENRISSILRDACSSDREVEYRINLARSSKKTRSNSPSYLRSKSSRSRSSKISRSRQSRKPY